MELLKKILTAKISDQYLYRAFFSVVLIALLAGAVFWLIGLPEPHHRFVLDPADQGRIQPIDLPWWRDYANRLHGRKFVMLTFDDGPGDREINETILRVLKKHHAPAAFFSVCRNARNEAGAQNLRAVAAAGHVVANHSFSHARLAEMPIGDLDREIVQCNQLLTDITGTQVNWFRPPWGQNSPAVLATLKAHHLRDVLWAANSGDSWLHSPEEVTRITMLEVSDNAIILMHSNEVEAKALDKSLTLLEEQGYRFVLAES